MSFELIGFISVILLVVYFLFARDVIEVSAPVFWIVILGAILGLSLGALVNITLLSGIPAPWGSWLQILANLFIVAVVINFFYNQRETMTNVFSHLARAVTSMAQDGEREMAVPEIVVDTSVIIDGRILEVAKVGFLMGKLLIPRFVLEELHSIADSSDEMKRTRGRRGLEVLNEIKGMDNLQVEIIEQDFPEEGDVDSKLVKLAKVRDAQVLTLDYNLNRVAQIQNLEVLNINDLHDALKPVVLPGEELDIEIVQEGETEEQGVGYLDDGTMVVVEDGHPYIGQEKTVTVNRMFQSSAGKMIFAEVDPKE